MKFAPKVDVLEDLLRPKGVVDVVDPSPVLVAFANQHAAAAPARHQG